MFALSPEQFRFGDKFLVRMKTYSAPSIGCYFDQGSRSDMELSIDIIDLAASFGRSTDADIQALIEREGNGDDLNADEIQWLYEDSEDAIEWLNSKEDRPFLYWANDGEANAFGLWPSVESAKEDVGFVSSRSEEYPADDFRGDWLHVSDHGNATLYVREDNKNGSGCYDREIWSVV
jgi:hypothetical protein